MNSIHVRYKLLCILLLITIVISSTKMLHIYSEDIPQDEKSTKKLAEVYLIRDRMPEVIDPERSEEPFLFLRPMEI